MQPEAAHVVTGAPAGPPAHAARPGPGRLPWLLAGAAVAAAAVAVLLASGDSATSAPPSARTITATSAPP